MTSSQPDHPPKAHPQIPSPRGSGINMNLGVGAHAFGTCGDGKLHSAEKAFLLSSLAKGLCVVRSVHKNIYCIMRCADFWKTPV